MCFSAAASFTAAALTTAVGAVCLTRVRHARELPLAATPILFGLQQAVEGFLWVNLPLASQAQLSAGLTVAFLLLAEVVWPVFAPAALALIEPDSRRRRLMFGLLALGVAVAGSLLWRILGDPPLATIVDEHVVYVTAWRYSPSIELGYLAATTLPLVLSSRRTLVALGLVVLVGSVVAYTLYWRAFVSVWCFFAALASVVILAHLQVARGRAQTSVAAEV